MCDAPTAKDLAVRKTSAAPRSEAIPASYALLRTLCRPSRYMELSLTCPRCGEEFPSAIQMDAETFTKIRLNDLIERCAQCGFSKRYQKAEYFFR